MLFDHYKDTQYNMQCMITKTKNKCPTTWDYVIINYRSSFNEKMYSLKLCCRQTRKTNKITDTDNRMVVTRGEGECGENEEGKRGQIHVMEGD